MLLESAPGSGASTLTSGDLGRLRRRGPFPGRDEREPDHPEDQPTRVPCHPHPPRWPEVSLSSGRSGRDDAEKAGDSARAYIQRVNGEEGAVFVDCLAPHETTGRAERVHSGRLPETMVEFVTGRLILKWTGGSRGGRVVTTPERVQSCRDPDETNSLGSASFPPPVSPPIDRSGFFACFPTLVRVYFCASGRTSASADPFFRAARKDGDGPRGSKGGSRAHLGPRGAGRRGEGYWKPGRARRTLRPGP